MAAGPTGAGVRSHCQFCGAGPYRSVAAHEWQCAENPDGKTAHYERFQAQGGRSEPITRPRGAAMEHGAVAGDQDHGGAGAGVDVAQFDAVHRPPEGAAPGGGQADVEDDPHICPKCDGDTGGPVSYCPECGAGPLRWPE